MDTKVFWQSKTFWLNALAGIAMVIQSQTSYVLDPEAQAGIIAFINIVMRFVTKNAISLS